MIILINFFIKFVFFLMRNSVDKNIKMIRIMKVYFARTNIISLVKKKKKNEPAMLSRYGIEMKRVMTGAQ